MKAERWQQVSVLFKSALEREPNERTAYLDETCSSDDSLRSQVESLIAAYEQAGDFIEPSALQVAAASFTDEQRESMVGQTIGHYAILRSLGSGGMGEVYLAHDSKLGRRVALKLLPVHYTWDLNRLHRFQQEARTVSALNHPNILTIYEIGETEGSHFIATEFIEGETLRQRMTGSPAGTARDGSPVAEAQMKPDEVLDIGAQVASALSAAHEAGIVHRDIKPENIMLRTDGFVKVLDFGLAKLTERAALTADTEAPTRAIVKTIPGMVMGTAAYMSPEQARGLVVDARTDIWSLGVVLYEMITGHVPFEGETATDVILSVVEREPPPLAPYSRGVPAELDRIIHTALRKNKEKRYQTVKDLLIDLKRLKEDLEMAAKLERLAPASLQDGATGTTSTAPHPPELKSVVGFSPRVRTSREGLWMGISVVLFGAAALMLILVIGYTWQTLTVTNLVRFTISPPKDTAFASGPVLSPDGRRLVLVASSRSEGRTSLWIRSLDAATVRPLAGTDGASLPFWSPDSRLIGFFAEGKLKKIDASGGPAETLCDAPNGRGGTWNREGVILFSPDVEAPIYRVPASGGTAVPVTRLGSDPSHRWPHFLPDGRHFLYLVLREQRDASEIYIASLNSEKAIRLLAASSSIAYAPPGYLLYVRHRALLAQQFDAALLRLAGEPFTVADEVGCFGEIGPTGHGAFSVSESGALVYGNVEDPMTQLVWFDRLGKQLEPVAPAGTYFGPALSPDGRRVAVVRADPKTRATDLWLLDLSRPSFSRFTFDSSPDAAPFWSPDGSRIAFGSLRRGRWELNIKASSGAVIEQQLPNTEDYRLFGGWSPDGTFLVARNASSDALWAFLLDHRKPFQLLQAPLQEASSHFHVDAQFSPDGRWLAYVSDESGRAEVYVQGFPPGGGKWQISNGGGDQPRWRRDVKELFYLTENKKLMSVEVKTSAVFEATVPAPLFETRALDYDVTADGQRFLLNTVKEAADSPVTVVLNWTAGSRQ
jgi:eukaryotic-like serine/threonine-protein kinase